MSIEMTRAADYALRAMQYLAKSDEPRNRFVAEIAEAMKIPTPFLHKVMPRLVSSQLVVSRRGAQGGYRLAKPAEEISVLEIIEAIDGPLVVNRCLLHGGECDLADSCEFRSILGEAQQAMAHVLSRHRLADVIPLRREAGRAEEVALA